MGSFLSGLFSTTLSEGRPTAGEILGTTSFEPFVDEFFHASIGFTVGGSEELVHMPAIGRFAVPQTNRRGFASLMDPIDRIQPPLDGANELVQVSTQTIVLPMTPGPYV